MARDDWRAWGYQGTALTWRPFWCGPPVYISDAMTRALAERYGEHAGGETMPSRIEVAFAIKLLIADGSWDSSGGSELRLAIAFHVDRYDVEPQPRRSHVEPGHDGDAPDWYRAGMTQWPRCEECDEPDSATCDLHCASGVARVCRECWIDLYGRERTPVTLAALRGRDARRRAARNDGREE